MAVNPITSESLTVDFKSLMSIPVGDRASAASLSSNFLQSILASLTPIQIAKAFPDYYRRSLPDISNFLAATRYFDGGGTAHQTGGGEQGYIPAGGYDGENKPGGRRPAGAPEPTIEEMKKKLLEKGIDVEGTYNAVKQGAVLESDEKYAYLKRMSDEELRQAGLERVKEEGGNVIIQALPSETASLSNEEIISRAESRRLDPEKFMDPVTSGKLRPEVIEKYKGKKLPVTIRNNNMGAMSLKDDSNKFVTEMPGYLDKTPRPANEGGYYARYATPEHGVAAASRNLESYARQGVTTPYGIVHKWAKDANPNYVNTVVKYLNDSGFKVDQNTDLDLSDPKVRIAILKGKSAFESGAGVPVYTDDVYETGASYQFESPRDPNKTYTEEEIVSLRQKEEEYQATQRQENLIRLQYNQASPTSSEAIPADGSTAVAIGDPNEQWGFEPGRNAEGTDPKLVAAMKLAAERFPLRVRFFSGSERGSGEHGAGMAGDTQIYDESGHPLSSYQDPRTMNAYAMYWQNVYDAAKELHGEEYANNLSWLGGDVRASGAGMPKLGERGNNNSYGTGDSMDIRVNRKGINYSEAFRVNQGWNPEYSYYTEEDYFGIGAKQGRFTEEDYSKLIGFKLSDVQKQQMAQREAEIGSASGYSKRLAATGGGIGERQMPVVVQTPQPITKDQEDPEMVETDPSKSQEQKVAEVVPTATPAPQFAQGGNMYGLNEDLTLVNTETGESVAQVGQDEKLVKQGNTMQVVSTSRLKADELSQKYDSSETENRLTNLESNIQEQQQQVPEPTAQKRDVQLPPQVRNGNDPWREASAIRQFDESPSHRRAMNRVRGRNESGPNQFDHFAKATVSSKV